ncbi:hypothetical protein BDU57DRAFT_70471 [Ampelomyces quisqualis]|uniref:Uncharacterized protein n=1 Tax=Ampelomyces quisqualis TaxID=50730 RepID=A0A6A5R322_AMPQU|nr:hypothetical protein BDU57DRAFT_70471 [Ampelomyces quisqualis]
MGEQSHLCDRSGKLSDSGTDSGHASRQISPPPLRRKRTGPETSHSFSNKSRPTAGSSHPSLSKEEVLCRRSSFTGTSKPTAKTTLFGDTQLVTRIRTRTAGARLDRVLVQSQYPEPSPSVEHVLELRMSHIIQSLFVLCVKDITTTAVADLHSAKE